MTPAVSSAKTTDLAIGRLLGEARRLSGITQRALAGAIGVSLSRYRKFEGGLARMTPAELAALAGALDVPMAYFFQDVPLRPGPPSSTGPFTPDEIEVIRSYRAIDDVQLRAEMRQLLRGIGGRFRPELLKTPIFQRRRR